MNFRDTVISLLNEYDNDDATIKAITMLYHKYEDALQKSIFIVFDDCDDWDSHIEQTAKANDFRIVICNDIRTLEFQTQKPSLRIPPHSKANHYCIVVLHEWGHLLDKNGLLDRDDDDNEKVANQWVYQFLENGLGLQRD